MAKELSSLRDDTMFRPPVNRAMRALDRSYFHKKISLAAATVLESRNIAKYRTELHDEMLKLDRVPTVKQDPRQKGLKTLLLKPEIRPENSASWSTKIQKLVEAKTIAITPYDLELNYDHWNYHEIMNAIMPEEEQDEYAKGFTIVGHVAHLNLREESLPYKHLIAEVLLDKNPTVRTVINKVDEVGEQNEYRTFKYEVLAGNDNMNVEMWEEGCVFRFDYSKVYWNSRLNTEHRRVVDLFQPGEAVCDVMAGVGPFAIPAGKKRVFVWANDLNPNSHASLADAVKRNKVSQFVQTFQEDGHSFIRNSAERLFQTHHKVSIPAKTSRTGPPPSLGTATVLTQPTTFNHYIMNLPASAPTFLPNFIGLYRGQEPLFAPYATAKLPMIHVHCFSTKSDDNKAEGIKICMEISEQLKHEVKPGDPEVTIWDVRDVAPQKRMFCASFRLPEEVAFRYAGHQRQIEMDSYE